MFYERQIEYNKDKIDRMRRNKVLQKIVKSEVSHSGITDIRETNPKVLNGLIDIILMRYGNDRPTSTERAAVCKMISEETNNIGTLMSGFCLRKGSEHYETDLHFHEKKARSYSHPSVPNCTYLVIEGVAYGLKEEMDFIDVISLE